MGKNVSLIKHSFIQISRVQQKTISRLRYTKQRLYHSAVLHVRRKKDLHQNKWLHCRLRSLCHLHHLSQLLY